jgi:hypothetical protein
MGISQEDLLLLIRALSCYQIDAFKNGDTDLAERAAHLIHEYAHELRGK